MVRNLAKSPLAAIFYAALLMFAAMPLPYSQGYTEASAQFSMPLTGFLFMCAYALWICVTMAVTFANVHSRGLRLILPLLAAVIGIQWAAPLLRQFVQGETTGAMSSFDTILWFAAGGASSVLLLILLMFLYRPPEKPEAAPDAPAPAETKYKIRILTLAVRLLVLPVIFCVLYYLAWYYLLWRSDAVREFYGHPERDTFIREIIRTLTEQDLQAVVLLIKGFVYAVFSLPLMFQMPGKRLMFIVTNTMLFLSGALLYLIPGPFMPDAVRIAHLMETGALLAVYGVLTALLTHTSLRRGETEASEPPPPAKPAAKPGTKPAQAAGRKEPASAAGAKK